MRAVNLLPADRRRGAKAAKVSGAKITKLHGIGIAVVLAGGALAYWGHGIAGQAADQSAKADELDGQVTSLTAQIAAERAKTAVQPAGQSFDADKKLVVGLAQARINWSTVIVNLSRIAPRTVWLESITVTTPTAEDTAGATGEVPTAISLSGRSMSRTAAVQFISRLDAIPGFEEPVLNGGINPDAEATGGGPVTYSFELRIPINDGIFGPIKPASATAPAATSTTTPSNG